MAELSPVIVKKTQDTLGKYVKKPNLSDKLLRKPPFKFLHDVINVVIQSTGFFKGLYTEDELNSENYRDREAKINFLQKAIDVVKIATKENISAKPSKIVAGLEPENTNEFLQAIGRAIDKKISSNYAVAAVKNGKADGEVKEKKVAKKNEGNGTGAKKAKDNSSTTQNTTKDSKNKTNQSKSVTKEEKDAISKKVPRQASNDSDISRTKVKSTKKQSDDKGVAKKVSSKGSPKEQKSQEPKNTVKSKKTEDKPKLREDNEKGNASLLKENGLPLLQTSNEDERDKNDGSITVDETPAPVVLPVESSPAENGHESATIDKSELEIEKSAPRQDGKQSEKQPDDEPVTSNAANSASSNKHSAKSRPTEDAPSKMFTKSDSVGQLRTTKLAEAPARKKISYIKSSTIDESIPPRPTTALRAPSARPPSARPGAPRRRDRNVEIILHSEKTMQSAAAEKNAINTVADLTDDGENLVVIDNTNIQGDPLAASNEPTVDNDKEQGHLVQQILETQTALSKTVNDGSDTKKDINDDMKTFIEKQSTSKNLVVIKESIQKLTRFISPLGKLLEYIHEDVEAMQSELVSWRQARVKAESAIKKEKEQMEKSMESFKYQLFEIESSIEDQTLQINSARANILENEEKLFKMVLDV